MTKEILTADNIVLGANLSSKEEAIRFTGKILVENGYVEASYVEKMLEREEITSTYIGNNVAIPHGTDDAKKAVKETGLSVVITPSGVDFNGNTVNILIGIAGKGDEHLEILSKIALVCAEEENIQKLIQASSKEEILNLFSGVN
ncbi:PTS system D-mannitol-specific IIA component, Fru family (TC 4.A.2.1.2) [Amphibacillus marinus]|uniref:Mannitol-specific phosphotransferase enzyme IIA component n=1 Tax=Amphibacillus marinus TaxID=872970 RepID=A0A1H8KCU6_9BACI|nr:PTS sugar transporter subunit IIA [Amphibacillus marinus]SEN90803.1 PTS system D-mannitol-specific IIA component, Fru family (TC 4.A.2.1.2) [Amphibacillus marinus]